MQTEQHPEWVVHNHNTVNCANPNGKIAKSKRIKRASKIDESKAIIVNLTNDVNKSKKKSLKMYQTTDNSSSSDNDKTSFKRDKNQMDKLMSMMVSMKKDIKKYNTTDNSSSSDNDKRRSKKSRKSQDSTKNISKLHSYKDNSNDNQNLPTNVFQPNNSSTEKLNRKLKDFTNNIFVQNEKSCPTRLHKQLRERS